MNKFIYYIEALVKIGSYAQIHRVYPLKQKRSCINIIGNGIFVADKTNWRVLMSYKVNDQRKQTMLQRLGDAGALIDDQRFLPFYRSIQIRLEKLGKPEEWAKMIELAKTKENPSHYFAKLCKMIKAGTYKFIEAVKEVKAELGLWISDNLVRFDFGKYQKYWVRKAQEFINVNGQAGFVELMEYAERKGINQKYMASALKNCKPPRRYYQENVLGGAK